jgi:hypothetical protein
MVQLIENRPQAAATANLRSGALSSAYPRSGIPTNNRHAAPSAPRVPVIAAKVRMPPRVSSSTSSASWMSWLTRSVTAKRPKRMRTVLSPNAGGTAKKSPGRPTTRFHIVPRMGTRFRRGGAE